MEYQIRLELTKVEEPNRFPQKRIDMANTLLLLTENGNEAVETFMQLSTLTDSWLHDENRKH